ncbi:hypothetical protein BWQ96_01885 [Gracilariopsis chorda]|uniref:Uncharacterized protein n=1 Tax=Gracilariopsis chorda TaxID=448386 RepID=A0A2V3J233_9FLOR|nr:hypothetical protein BWQ96_01885 [Gracilariopsis chorda]|eukprot:PXF48425.1 hypothetical protein BWQ96_01885 [Gracilariopsis chorda]
MAGARGCETGDGDVQGLSPQDSIIKLENDTLSSDKMESDENDAEQKIRPTRRRKGKELLKRSTLTEKKMRLAEEPVAAQVECNAAFKRYYEILLFTSAWEGCDEVECVEYFNIMRYRALKELCKTSSDVLEEGKSVSEDANESGKTA